MAETELELELDPAIRLWVLLPIFLISLLFSLATHYITSIFSSSPEKNLSQQDLADMQALVRAKLLKQNGRYIPKEGFLARKSFFNNSEDGYFKQARPALNILRDPSAMVNMQMGRTIHIIPMMIIGGWMSFVFSGFVLTKVPFPVTPRFKSMLQSGLDIPNLDASWVSSISLYFLCAFGLRSIYNLILGENNAVLDQTKMFKEQTMSGQGAAMAANLKQQDMNKLFTSEWEGLEVIKYEDGLENIIEELLISENLLPTPLSITAISSSSTTTTASSSRTKHKLK